jgi:multisubunit Na+/H+ antiporter MnhF subunit
MQPHPTATPHLPAFITAPGETDVLLVAVTVILIAAVLAAGVFFLWLHSLPERMVHNRVQFDVVAVLALLSLFTHIHAFWVAALLLALIKIPDFSFPNVSKPLNSIAGSLETMAAEPPVAAIAKPDQKATVTEVPKATPITA